GIRLEHTDLFGMAGREFLAGLELPAGSRRRLDSLMALIADFDREITAATREIDARAKIDERVDVLCQIRGIGRYTAMLIIAKVAVARQILTLCYYGLRDGEIRCLNNQPGIDDHDRELAEAA